MLQFIQANKQVLRKLYFNINITVLYSLPDLHQITKTLATPQLLNN